MSDLKEWMNPLLPADDRVRIADGEIERLKADWRKAFDAGIHHQEDAKSLRTKLAAAEARAERYRAALKYIIDDLEIRSQWKTGDQKGVVDIGHGAYMQGKAALAEGEAG